MKPSLSKLLLISLISILSHGARGQSVALLETSKHALNARKDLILNAKEEIKLSYFLIATDKTSMSIFSLLHKKAREGVSVKILVDGMFNQIDPKVVILLDQVGVEIKVFNKLKIYHLTRAIKHRMHDKLFIVDSEKMIIGGRNMEDNYYGNASPTKNFVDRDVYIQGDIVADASSYFDKLWEAQHTSDARTTSSHKKCQYHLNRKDRMTGEWMYEKCVRKFDGKVNNLKREIETTIINTTLELNERSFESRWDSNIIEADSSDFLHDKISSTKVHGKGTAKAIYKLIDSAKSSVFIDSPYLIPTEEMYEVFRRAIKRGVYIRIVTNSLKSTDGILPQSAYLNEKKRLTNLGVDVYEYFAEDRFHSKSIAIDRKLTVIGSFNFDPRSQNLNTETAIVIEDPLVTAIMSENMEEVLSFSLKVLEDGTLEGTGKSLPGVKKHKRMLTRFIQYFIAPFAKGLF